MVSRLTSSGFDLRLVDDDSITRETVEDADLVVISLSVVPSKVPGWIHTTAVPILNNEVYVSPLLGLGDRPAEVTGSIQLQLVGDHQILGGRTGRTTVAASTTFGVVTGADGVQVLATRPGQASRHALLAAEQGTSLRTGAAPARRVASFLAYDTPGALNIPGLVPLRRVGPLAARRPRQHLTLQHPDEHDLYSSDHHQHRCDDDDQHGDLHDNPCTHRTDLLGRGPEDRELPDTEHPV